VVLAVFGVALAVLELARLARWAAQRRRRA
jgi:hypothetical protein